MSQDYKNLKEEFLRSYGYQRRYVSQDDIDKMSDEEREKYANSLYDSITFMRYVNEPLQIEEDELDKTLLFHIIKLQEQQKRYLSSINGMLVFWTVVGIILIVIKMYGA